jgi:mono/diheme cytochrome c family protein
VRKSNSAGACNSDSRRRLRIAIPHRNVDSPDRRKSGSDDDPQGVRQWFLRGGPFAPPISWEGPTTRNAVWTVTICLGLVATAAAQDAKVTKGQQLFADQKCALCHSIGDKGNKKGPLDGVASKLSADEIRSWITDAKGMTAKTKAPRKPEIFGNGSHRLWISYVDRPKRSRRPVDFGGLQTVERFPALLWKIRRR